MTSDDFKNKIDELEQRTKSLEQVSVLLIVGV